MYCSIIIPTIGRQSVDKSVRSVLDQTFSNVDFEIIIVNDSGEALPYFEWINDDRVRIIQTNRRRLCVARNTGAAVACGKYLLFLDDDDWLHPLAFKNFWEISTNFPEAVALYGGVLYIDTAGNLLGELNMKKSGDCLAELMGGAQLMVQCSLIKSEVFYKVGGFDPLIEPGEEFELWRKIAPLGRFANTSEPTAYILRGSGWTSTCPREKASQAYCTIRDRAVNQKGSLTKFRISAGNHYWKGRTMRMLFVIAVWNLRQFRILTFLSRILWGFGWLVISATSIFSKEFWHAITDKFTHYSPERILPP